MSTKLQIRELIRRRKDPNAEVNERLRSLDIFIEQIVKNTLNEKMEKFRSETERILTEEIRQKVDAEIARLKTENISEEAIIKATEKAVKETLKNIKGDKGDTPIAGRDFPIPKDGEDGEDGEDGKTPVAGVDFSIPKDGTTPVAGVDFFTESEKKTFVQRVFDIVLTSQNRLRDALASLQGNERLDISAIKGIDERFNKIFEQIAETRSVKGGTKGGGGHELITDDLSSQTDGSTTTFTLTKRTRPNTVMLYGTDFPQVYRPVIDFIESSDGRSVTIDTSQVQAPSSEATLIARYQKKTD